MLRAAELAVEAGRGQLALDLQARADVGQLYHLFPKLGITTRAQLADAALRSAGTATSSIGAAKLD